MPPPLPLQFVLSADNHRQLPDSPAEVAVIGRSNVGKSSLLNALANRKELARTSKTPGRTQLLNCFVVDDIGTVVDCPGYGYAAVSGATRASWPRMIERYLLERDPLRMILALVDGEIGPTKLDVQALAWLADHSRRYTIVATKQDKVRSSRRGQRAKELAAGCGVDPDQVVWVSAAKGAGIDKLRGLVHRWLVGSVGSGSGASGGVNGVG